MEVVKHLGLKKVKGKEVYRSIGRCSSCGSTHEVNTEYLLNSKRKKCRKCKKVTHGLSHHPLYTVWKGMLDRCYNPKNKHFKNYGALGVTVCDSWKNSVQEFVSWGMANGYVKGLKIDKDVKSGEVKEYSSNTCQFVTSTVNNRATRILRKTNTSGYRGVYFNKKMKEWAAAIKVDYKAIPLGLYETPLLAAKVYDSYINKHNLEHTKNNVLNKNEYVEPSKKAIRRTNTSGFTGVNFRKDVNKWRAYINVNKKQIGLGYYKNLEDAVSARKAGELKYLK